MSTSSDSSITRLGQLLSKLTVASTRTSDQAPTGPVAAVIPPPAPDTPQQHIGEPVCSICGLRFSNWEEQRNHFKTDFHRFNQQRRLKKQSIVTEDEFEDLSDVSSIDASDSDSDVEEDDDDEQQQKRVNQQRSPLIEFLMPDGKALFVYRATLSSTRDFVGLTNDDLLGKLQSLQKQKYWTMFMTGAGHFAGAVFDLATGKPLVHKTLHRYTTRRKQGGAQSANDKSKGNAHSAGAGLRRYNEMALERDIQELMILWKEQIQLSGCIFLRASQSSRKSFFSNTSILAPDDGRIRTYPFNTRRATFKELQRAYKELTMVRIADATQYTTETDTITTPVVVKNVVPQPIAVPVDEGPPLLEPFVVKVIDLTKRGKVDLLSSQLQIQPDIIHTKLADSYGTSLLHIASQASQPDCVELLLSLGSNPTVKNIRNLRPYDVASDKDTRNAFRRVMYRQPEAWDWKDAHVPSALSPEMEEEQRIKDKAKKAAQREKEKASKKANAASASSKEPVVEPAPSSSSSLKKSIVKLSKTEVESIGMSPEARARLDREKRALAAEARMRSQQSKCANCGKSLEGLVSFDKLQ
ncbi:hypothetical protein SmJEL517_g02421 [Synchytrium microbalum]|uniref:VLRF1 domain-containing protein n=1 Tax=Synchytrium microbalum TaxID=1806994 RepID=A0A507C0G8_9FUNG|nr:uncharacterized protein SmJEL517_g02421 [Synchytrium microbalum]TPX35030.1 hypothetical protein SmJEL517_g02421 [Synchytrium microbalum]